MVEDVELNRLYWHSRRGMLELDVLLVPFVREAYSTLNEVDRNVYVRLLSVKTRTCSAGSWSAPSPKTRSCNAWSG
jgi:succinate dehydrogenase flavin-adding protein (antitoxin of CptAB toxin-antitoxin module)